MFPADFSMAMLFNLVEVQDSEIPLLTYSVKKSPERTSPKRSTTRWNSGGGCPCKTLASTDSYAS